MKKIVLVLAALTALASQTPLFAAVEYNVVSSFTGNPQILRNGETIPVSARMLLYSGDIVKTPTPESRVDLSVSGLAGCRVLPSSEFTIVNGNWSNMRMKIVSGNAILNLAKLPKDSSFELETPTAIAAVRGTQFWGRVDAQNPGNPVTTFAVREGTVEIFAKTAGKLFNLEKGQALDIPADASVIPLIRPALDAEMQAMAQASSISTSA